MNGKTVGCCGSDPPLLRQHVNPFVHKLELPSTYAKIKTGFLTVAILPARVAAICGLLVLAWCVACIGLYGVSDEDLRTRPMTGWRKKLRDVISLVGQLTYVVGGMSITVKGRQASRQEAPILVIAPHSTFLDAVIVYVTGFPSIIARWESGLNPWLGKLINYTQPVYVWRNDADSRQSTIREITRRAKSSQDWPQVLIFPEGTCTNRSCLITFKCGAFYPGVPIQPVILRYPNKMDTVTWTWEGPGALKLLWLTLTQLHTNCEIEFLPVYKPSPEEKDDPKLYATNVRKVMAKALGIPVTNFTYDHGRLITTAQRLHLPLGGSLVEMQGLRESLGVQAADEQYLSRPLDGALINLDEFAKRLQVLANNAEFKQLFNLCKTSHEELVDWTDYLLAVLVISTNGRLLHIMEHLFIMINKKGDGKILKNEFESICGRALSWTREKSTVVFDKITVSHPDFITFDEFRRYAENCEDLRHLFRGANRTRLKSD